MKVSKIETTKPILIPRKKVAAYARVSMESEKLAHSLSAQISYYSELIQSNPEWEYVGVYADNFISGTGTARRAELQRLLDDCEGGRVDIVLTKSISRFARNTVDSLTTIRKLKEHGTEVYFEKESIWTFDSKGEMLLTILSSLSQEESRSISENVKWGQRKRMADGKFSMPYSKFLGYEKGEDGRMVVNEDQAKVVEQIYGLFIAGLSPLAIAKKLTDAGIPSPTGREKWYEGTVRSILKNEKYKGCALLQKTFTPDFLTKKAVANDGTVPQYYVGTMWKTATRPSSRRSSLLWCRIFSPSVPAIRNTAGQPYSPGRSAAGAAAGGMARRSGTATTNTAGSSGSAITSSKTKPAARHRT